MDSSKPLAVYRYQFTDQDSDLERATKLDSIANDLGVSSGVVSFALTRAFYNQSKGRVPSLDARYKDCEITVSIIHYDKDIDTVYWTAKVSGTITPTNKENKQP